MISKLTTRGVILTLLIALLACVISCKSNSEGSGNANGSRATSAPAAKGTASAPAAAGQRLTFNSPDGVQIVGTFYPTAQGSAPAVLMLHQWMGSRDDYEALAKEFQAKQIAVLAIDGRGFGESTKKGDKTVEPGRTAEDVKLMLGDVASALTFLAAQPGVDRNRIGVIGASYGSSLALIDAARDKNIKALALLSPGLNYFMNLPTEPAIQEYGDRPLLIVAAEDDEESANATRRLDSLVQGNRHQSKVFPGGAHGTGILESGVGLDQMLLEFFSRSL